MTTPVREMPGWAVVEAMRAAEARRSTSIAARVRAWRDRVRARKQQANKKGAAK